MSIEDGGDSRGSMVVIGDAVIDRYRIIVKERDGERTADGNDENWKYNSEWQLATVCGGPFLLREMICGLREEHRAEEEQHYNKIRLRSYAEISSVHRTRADEKNKVDDKVWRVTKFGGYSAESGNSSMAPLPELAAGDCKASSLIVIDDAGNGFRKHHDAWQPTLKRIDDKAIIVHKMFLPLEESVLWKSIAQTAKDYPSSSYITVVNADDLRRQGLNISKRRSWSQTYRDLKTLLVSKIPAGEPRHPLAALLDYDLPARSADYLIVRFSCDAAACIDSSGAVAFVGVPGAAEGDFDNAHPGMMVGLMSSFVARLAQGLREEQPSKLSQGVMKRLTRSALVACRSFAAGSVETVPVAGQKHLRIHWANAAPAEGDLVDLEFDPSAPAKKPSAGFEGRFPSEWQQAQLCLRKGEKTLKTLPSGMFGKLFTVDSGEIEGFRSIGDLFLRHIENRKRTKPISVGVFGPPGAGKSFGIKQVADTIAGDAMQIIELNVAQFGERSLTLAMHRVRDAVLRGKRPLCLFDEFDTGGLKYLSHFLAPMQDGEFEDDGVIRPIGPAIFVFVGGVFTRYEDVVKALNGDDAKKYKLPDFVSRLSGYVDIRGPNPLELHVARQEAEVAALSEGNKKKKSMAVGLFSIRDGSFLLRRAILLRRLLEEHLPGVIDPDNKSLSMDSVVLDAFLGVLEYLHGARSMEAVIRMSSVDRSSTHFPISALPSKDQLKLHVDVDQFFKLLKE